MSRSGTTRWFDLRLAAAALLWIALGAAATAECRDDRIALRGDWGQVEFRIDLADTDETRTKGLMFVEKLPKFSGMLFIYPRPQQARFWMKNTLISLDMLFLDATGTVRSIHENAEPMSTALIEGGKGILAVLEINGGLSAKLGLRPGDVARHTAFGASAAWPCEDE
jgi:uncharacterized membrane protein (UPF0127 family)